jgi:hypothetical protein
MPNRTFILNRGSRRKEALIKMELMSLVTSAPTNWGIFQIGEGAA